MLASEGKAHVPSKAREEWNEKNQPGKRAVSSQHVPTLQPAMPLPDTFTEGKQKATVHREQRTGCSRQLYL